HDEPDSELLGERAKLGQRRVVRFGSRLFELGAAIGRHEIRILRRGDETRAILMRGADQGYCVTNIAGDVLAATELNAGGPDYPLAHGGFSSASSLPARSSA